MLAHEPPGAHNGLYRLLAGAVPTPSPAPAESCASSKPIKAFDGFRGNFTRPFPATRTDLPAPAPAPHPWAPAKHLKAFVSASKQKP